MPPIPVVLVPAMQTPLVSLWLPIVLSALVVFFAGFALWMVLPHHRNDWKGLPREDEVLGALERAGVPPGQYAFPHMKTRDAMKDPAWLAKAEGGPTGLLVVRKPGPLTMGTPLALSLVHNLAISTLVAYLAGILLPEGTSYGMVFRVTSAAAFLAYAGAWPTLSIWFHHDPRVLAKHVLDAAVQAALLGGVFGWLWPGVPG